MLIVFRAQLGSLMKALNRAKVGPVELLWHQQLREVRGEVALGLGPAAQPLVEPVPSDEIVSSALIDELGDLARTSPTAAVVQAHDRVRDELRKILADAWAPGPARNADTAVVPAAAAGRRGLITNQTMFAIEGLTMLRNLALSGEAETTRDRALSYLLSADAALYAVRQNVRTARTDLSRGERK